MKPLRFIAKYGRLMLGGSIILLMVLGSIFAPYLTEHDPYELDLTNRKQLPDEVHIMGTDNFGRDIYARILYGAQTTMIVAFGSKLLSIGLGTVLGLICGYYKHALKNTLSLVGTNIATSFAGVLGGSAITERVFGIKSLGTLAVTSLSARDYNQEQAIVLFGALMCLGVNLILDLFYKYLDPRIQFE